MAQTAIKSRRRAVVGAAALLFGLGAALGACGDDDNAGDAERTVDSETADDTAAVRSDGEKFAAFIELAEDASCAGDANALYLIDDELVVWHTEDLGCADASYQITLFGSSPDEVLCSASDSIEGPRVECEGSSYEEDFETIVDNIEADDLGLGDDHTVEVIRESGD